MFRKAKDWPIKKQVTGIIYKVRQQLCRFIYIGESKFSWKVHGADHCNRRKQRMTNKTTCLREGETGHDIHPHYDKILKHGIKTKQMRNFF